MVVIAPQRCEVSSLSLPLELLAAHRNVQQHTVKYGVLEIGFRESPALISYLANVSYGFYLVNLACNGSISYLA